MQLFLSCTTLGNLIEFVLYLLNFILFHETLHVEACQNGAKFKVESKFKVVNLKLNLVMVSEVHHYINLA